MISISSLMTVGLLTAILAGLVWFVLSRLVRPQRGSGESRACCGVPPDQIEKENYMTRFLMEAGHWSGRSFC